MRSLSRLSSPWYTRGASLPSLPPPPPLNGPLAGRGNFLDSSSYATVISSFGLLYPELENSVTNSLGLAFFTGGNATFHKYGTAKAVTSKHMEINARVGRPNRLSFFADGSGAASTVSAA